MIVDMNEARRKVATFGASFRKKNFGIHEYRCVTIVPRCDLKVYQEGSRVG